MELQMPVLHHDALTGDDFFDPDGAMGQRLNTLMNHPTGGEGDPEGAVRSSDASLSSQSSEASSVRSSRTRRSFSEAHIGQRDQRGSTESTGGGGDNYDVQEAIKETFRALKSNLTQSRSNAKTGRTHKRATHIFMSGAAQLNHAENM